MAQVGDQNMGPAYGGSGAGYDQGFNAPVGPGPTYGGGLGPTGNWGGNRFSMNRPGGPDQSGA